MTNEFKPEKDSPEQKDTRGDASAPTLENPAEKLDFTKLDLSVEKVDERISPSETNVFDK